MLNGPVAPDSNTRAYYNQCDIISVKQDRRTSIFTSLCKKICDDETLTAHGCFCFLQPWSVLQPQLAHLKGVLDIKSYFDLVCLDDSNHLMAVRLGSPMHQGHEAWAPSISQISLEEFVPDVNVHFKITLPGASPLLSFNVTGAHGQLTDINPFVEPLESNDGGQPRVLVKVADGVAGIVENDSSSYPIGTKILLVADSDMVRAYSGHRN